MLPGRGGGGSRPVFGRSAWSRVEGQGWCVRSSMPCHCSMWVGPGWREAWEDRWADLALGAASASFWPGARASHWASLSAAVRELLSLRTASFRESPGRKSITSFCGLPTVCWMWFQYLCVLRTPYTSTLGLAWQRFTSAESWALPRPSESQSAHLGDSQVVLVGARVGETSLHTY